MVAVAAVVEEATGPPVRIVFLGAGSERLEPGARSWSLARGAWCLVVAEEAEEAVVAGPRAQLGHAEVCNNLVKFAMDKKAAASIVTGAQPSAMASASATQDVQMGGGFNFGLSTTPPPPPTGTIEPPFVGTAWTRQA